MKRLYLLALLPMVAVAQSAPATVVVNWVAPTLTADGSPLTGSNVLTKYQIFVSTQPIADGYGAPPTTEVTSGTTTTVNMNVAAGSTLYVRVKACNSTGCSLFSNQASKLVTILTPAPPTSVTITLTVTP
jgi:hypothetical protein